MADKTILVLIVLFVLAGVITYEGYLQKKGEPGPVAGIIDMAGLSKKDEPLQEIKHKTINEEFQYLSKKDILARMQIQQQEIEKKRNELLEKRAFLLQQLEQVSQDTKTEARQFEAIILNEQKVFLEQFPPFSEIGQTILSVQNEPDPVLRRESIDRIKGQIIALYQANGNMGANFERVEILLSRINQILTEDPALVSTFCEDAEKCLKDNVGQLQLDIDSQLSDLETLPQRDYGDMMEMVNLMGSETRFLKTNSLATENGLKLNSAQVESQMKNLVEGLVKVTEEDLIELMDKYDALITEQQSLLRNLEEHQRRYFDLYDSSFARIDGVFDRLKKFSFLDLSPLMENINSIKEKGKAVLESFLQNESSLFQNKHKSRYANEQYIKHVAYSDHIDFDQLIDEIRSNSQRKYESIKDMSQMKMDAGVDIEQKRRDDMYQQENKKQQVEQMHQQMRSNVKDAGFH